MAIVRWTNRQPWALWSPWKDLESQMNRILGEVGEAFGPVQQAWAPAVDFRESEEAYTLEADVPGLKKEDIRLEILEDRVTISGERKHEAEKEGEGYRRIERSSGRFERSFRIPEGFDAEGAEATFEDGVLRVTLPKREADKPRLVEVKAG